jgi:3-dehydroquinate synthetase
MEREPYDYETNADLNAETNRELRIVHQHLNKLKALYAEIEAELEELKKEKAKLLLEYEKRFNAIENEQKLQRTMLEGMEKVLGKIDSNTDATRKIAIQLLGGGVITALITFVFKFFSP